MIRAQIERGVDGLERSGEILLAGQDIGQVVVGRKDGRIEPYRFPVRFDRSIKIIGPLEGVSQTESSRGRFRL